MTMTHVCDPCNIVVEMPIHHEELLADLAKEKSVETQGSQGKKRKFFKKKGAQNGDTAKKSKAEVVCYRFTLLLNTGQEMGRKMQERRM